LFGDGKGNGMVSKVAENIPNEFMSFQHLGVMKDGVEETGQQWTNAFEDYRLKADGNKTELTVTMDVEEEYINYFEKTWPKALEILKELAEK